MIQTQVKEQLNELVDQLSVEQAELLLDFAVLLRQRRRQDQITAPIESMPAPTVWEAALVAAEEYWFQLPEAIRRQYEGKTVALLRDRLLDADAQLSVLRKRISAQYPDQPVLYLEADAEPLPPLYVRSPRLG